MKKIIVVALATIAIAATALIAVPALAKDSPAQSQAQTAIQTLPVAVQPAPVAVQAAPVVAQPAPTSTTSSLYTGYGAAFCGGGLVMNDQVTLQRVAATLGITYDQLVQDLNNGQTIASIATAQKVDISKVVDTVVAAQTDMVNVLVKYGYITQDQANTIIANLRTRVEAVLSGTAPTTGYGMMGGIVNGTGYGYGMMGSGFVTPPATTPVTGYGYGMMGW